VKRDLDPLAAKSEEHVEAYGRRRIELRIARREEATGLGRRTAVEVERTLGVPAWTPAFHLVLTCTRNTQTENLNYIFKRNIYKKFRLPVKGVYLRVFGRAISHIF